MLRRSHPGRGLALALLSLAAVGCTDRIPTAGGAELFPGGARPATLEVTLPAGSFLQALGRFSGFTGPADAPFLLVANRFEGSLEANALGRLAAFPQTITYSQGGVSRTDSLYAFVRAQLFAPVDTSASVGTGAVTLRLWEVGEDWDPATATWQLAADTAGKPTPWRTPGGTRGAALSTVSLPQGVRSAGDTLRFALDSLAFRRVVGSDFRGFLVTAEGAPVRLQTGNFALRAEVRPRSASPDTTVSVPVGAARQTFVFTPEPPRPATAWEAGGIRSARTLFRVDLRDVRVPTCAQGGAACATVPLREVQLNQVALLLRPVPVPGGFGPVGPMPLLIRRVVEPELGRRAPLGEIVNDIEALSQSGNVLYRGNRFVSTDSVFTVPLTGYLTGLVASDSAVANLALLGQPEAASFGTAWFAPSPSLRIVYTVPARPSLP